MDSIDWPSLNTEERKAQLYIRQKELLDTLLDHHAISKTQHDTSLHDLTIGMGINVPAAGRNEKEL